MKVSYRIITEYDGRFSVQVSHETPSGTFTMFRKPQFAGFHDTLEEAKQSIAQDIEQRKRAKFVKQVVYKKSVEI